MEGRLYKIILTQAEMYDLGNVKDIDHHILYDSETKIAIDITADVKQAPLLSHVAPYEVLSEEGVAGLEKYISGELKPTKDWMKSGIPCVTDIEISTLDNNEKIKVSMRHVYEARKNLDKTIDTMRKDLFEAKLINPKKED